MLQGLRQPLPKLRLHHWRATASGEGSHGRRRRAGPGSRRCRLVASRCCKRRCCTTASRIATTVPTRVFPARAHRGQRDGAHPDYPFGPRFGGGHHMYPLASAAGAPSGRGPRRCTTTSTAAWAAAGAQKTPSHQPHPAGRGHALYPLARGKVFNLNAGAIIQEHADIAIRRWPTPGGRPLPCAQPSGVGTG
ncbi:MAG: hypothetical protein WKG07_49055 [Hymenobacter sp.]